MYCSSPRPKEVHQAARTGLGKTPSSQPATTTHHSSTAYATSPSNQLRCPPSPLLLPRPVSSVPVPRREDGESRLHPNPVHTPTRFTHSSFPLETPTTRPSPPHRHLKTSTQPDNIKLSPPPTSCLRLPVSRLPVSYPPLSIHLRYPTAVRPLDITKQPACQPAPSESESRPLLGILCSLPSAASML